MATELTPTPASAEEGTRDVCPDLRLNRYGRCLLAVVGNGFPGMTLALLCAALSLLTLSACVSAYSGGAQRRVCALDGIGNRGKNALRMRPAAGGRTVAAASPLALRMVPPGSASSSRRGASREDEIRRKVRFERERERELRIVSGDIP